MDYSQACQWLGIEDTSQTLDEATLKRSFRKVVLQEHPDKSSHPQATQRFQSITRAHDFLIGCVARGETGRMAPSYQDDQFDEDDEDDEYYYDNGGIDPLDILLAHLFARERMPFGFRGRPGGGFGFPAPPGGFRGASVFDFSNPSYYNYDPNLDEEEDDKYYHDYYERQKQAAQRKAEAKARRLAEQYQRAKDEGRDCFEEWTIKALQQEATRRGLNVRGLQRQSIVELLMEEDRVQREKQELKAIAPLLDEWVEIVNLATTTATAAEEDPSNKKHHLNGIKARAVDYDKDKECYIVEWEDPAAKKKSLQHRHMYGDKNKKQTIRVSPKNIILWGSSRRRGGGGVEESTTTTTHEEPSLPQPHHEQPQSSSSSNPAPQKKSRRKGTPKQQQQQPPQESPMDRFERLSREMAGQVNLGTFPPSSAFLPTKEDSDTQFIQHKVKCPKGKKPGDILEFTNPHIPGQKQRVVIPPDAKPDKFFKVQVPLPTKQPKEIIRTCARCAQRVEPKADQDEQHQEEETTDKNKTNVALGVPLRACAHYCCATCYDGVLEGGKCPTCSAPLPKVDVLDLLPYIQQLSDPPAKLKEALLDEYYCGKEELRSGSGKKEKEALDEASWKVTKEVDRHYRRTSIKMHPDRFGEQFRKEFDALTKARDVMRDEKLRQKYVHEMLDIACKVDPGYIPQSHLIWIKKNDVEVEDHAKAAPVPGKVEEVLQLDGGLAFSKPKRPRMFVQNQKSRQVRLYLPVANEYQFQQYCESVTVVGNCSDLEEEELQLALMTRSKLDIQDEEIRCIVTLPTNGIWDIMWSATLVIDGIQRQTPFSAEGRLDFRSREQLAMAKKKDGMETLARRVANEIRSQLRAHDMLGKDDRQKIEASHEKLHQVISKGRDVSRKLSLILRSMAIETSQSLRSLLGILEEASQVQVQLDQSIMAYGKRDARKAFRKFIASKLEHGDSELWMSNVTEKELEGLGGSSNRLYQLLIEGKKANSLAFNDTTLDLASKRDDLFSEKQRENLKKREMEVASLLAADMEAAMKAEEEENAVKRLETMARQVNVKHGDFVKIQGLDARADLNGALGTYLGVAHGDRYSIRIHAEDKIFALRGTNFRPWNAAIDGNPHLAYMPQAKAWTCGACTFENCDADASMDVCIMCRTAKGANAPAPIKETKDSKPPEKNLPAASTNKTQPAKLSKATSEVGKTKSSPVKLAEDSVASKKMSDKPNFSSGKNCSLGLSCPDLRVGPEVCQYEHLPEEIAVFHPSHPSAIAASVLDEVPLGTTSPGNNKPPLDTQSTAASVGKRATRCKYGDKCRNLKHGPDKCKFFHTPEETSMFQPTKIASEHPNVIKLAPSSRKSSTTTATSQSEDTSNKNSVITRKVLISSDVAPIIVGKGRKRLIALQEKSGAKMNITRKADANGMNTLEISGTSAAVEKANDLVNDIIRSQGESKSAHSPVRRNILIETTSVPILLARKQKTIKSIMKKTGATLAVSRDADANGCCNVAITGNSDAVQAAAKIIIDVTLNPTASRMASSSEESSLMSELTGDELVLSQPTIVSPASSSCGNLGLLGFLCKNKSSLKCSPEKFLDALKADDIETISDLAEAFADKEYVNELQSKGLKGFKRGPFFKAAQVALSATSSRDA